MSDFMQRLIDAALNKVAPKEGDTMPRSTQHSLEAGGGLQWRDMSSTERTKKLDRDKHRRAAMARRVKEQVDRAAERVQEHEDIDEVCRDVDAFEVGDKVRFGRALLAVDTMDRIVSKVAYDKFMRSRRLARGAFDKDDVIQHTKLCVALEIAKSERNMDEIDTAAKVIDHRGLVDYGDEVPHVQWLMGVMSNRAKSSIRHLCQTHPTIDSIDKLDTMLANVGGVDTLIASCKADNPPAMSGYRMHAPGRHGLHLDPLVIAVALDREITRRHLDDLIDLILDDDRRRYDGTFEWSKHYVEVLAACGEPVRKFDSPTIGAAYARKAARRSMAWVNEFLRDVLAAYDGTPRKVWSNGRETTHVDMLQAHTERQWVPVIQMPDPDAMAKTVIRVLAQVLAEAIS